MFTAQKTRHFRLLLFQGVFIQVTSMEAVFLLNEDGKQLMVCTFVIKTT